MLHTKFRGNQPACSREEDFDKFLPYWGVALGHVTSIISSDFHFRVPRSFHTKVWFRSAQ